MPKDYNTQTQVINYEGEKTEQSQMTHHGIKSVYIPKAQNLNEIFNTTLVKNFEAVEVSDSYNLDPQKVAEYQSEIFSYLKKIEPDFLPKFPYMKGFQTDINDKMRSILIDWLVDVHLKFKLLPETLFLTVNLIDRFLSNNVIMRTKLQLVGVTAMLIACKYEEIYAPEVRDFVYITDQAYTKEEILKAENNMLNCLEFNITTPSSLRFLEFYSNYLNLDDQSFMFCKYLIELFLVDLKANKYNPSLLSASAIYITLKITKKNEFLQIVKISEYHEDKLRECAKDICLILDSTDKSSLKAVKKKFSHEKYLQVAKIKFF